MFAVIPPFEIIQYGILTNPFLKNLHNPFSPVESIRLPQQPQDEVTSDIQVQKNQPPIQSKS